MAGHVERITVYNKKRNITQRSAGPSPWRVQELEWEDWSLDYLWLDNLKNCIDMNGHRKIKTQTSTYC